MEQRDYLLQQIQQLARVLAKISADLAGWNPQGDIVLYLAQVEEQLITESDLDLEAIMLLENSELPNFLSDTFNDNEASLTHLAEIFAYKGQYQKEYSKAYYIKSLAIYEYLNTVTKTYHIERQDKIKMLQETLINLKK